MRRISTLAAALATVFSVGAANAADIVIDNFDLPAPTGVTIADNTGLGVSLVTAGVNADVSSRTLTHRLVTAAAVGSNAAGNLSSAGIGAPPNFVSNQLNLSNGNQVDSNVSVFYTLNAITASAPASFALDVIQTNIGVPALPGNAVTAFLDGNLLDNNVILNSFAGTLYFALSAADILNLSTAGTILEIRFQGDEGWDMSVDNLRLQVPEPTSLALVGLALIGAGVASRRRKA